MIFMLGLGETDEQVVLGAQAGGKDRCMNRLKHQEGTSLPQLMSKRLVCCLVLLQGQPEDYLVVLAIPLFL